MEPSSPAKAGIQYAAAPQGTSGVSGILGPSAQASPLAGAGLIGLLPRAHTSRFSRARSVSVAVAIEPAFTHTPPRLDVLGGSMPAFRFEKVLAAAIFGIALA